MKHRQDEGYLVLLRSDGQYNDSPQIADERVIMTCIRCDSERTRKDGQTRLGGQRWRCNDCHRRFTARSTSAFSHHGFPDDVIALAVRWYIRYRLSYADVVEWFAERGLVVNRSNGLPMGPAIPAVVWRSCPCSSTTSRSKMAG